MNSRLVQIINSHDCTVAELAILMGITRSPIFRWINGKCVPTTDSLIKLQEVWPDVDLHWLITGKKHNGTIIHRSE
jgi:transcriptional regulator with XRE-family HTH domain